LAILTAVFTSVSGAYEGLLPDVQNRSHDGFESESDQAMVARAVAVVGGADGRVGFCGFVAHI
jgi:hypothetical protein